MKKIMLLATMTAFLAGCGEDKTETNTPTAVKSVAVQADILNYIPENTPLLMTSGLNPAQYPARYLEVMQKNMFSVVEYFDIIIDNALEKESTNFVTSIDEDGEEVITEEVDAEDAVMKAKMKTLADKWMTDDLFDKLGIKMGETQMAIYMIDLFPVLRMKLSKGNQINALLDDMEQTFEVPVVKSDVNGQQVREFQADKATFLISTNNDYLVVSATPSVIKDQLFNRLLGVDKPKQTLAQNPALITEVKNTHGYVVDDLMLINVQQIADYFIYPGKHNSALVNFMQIDDNMLSAACKSEISAMIANAPRMVAGSKVLTNDTVEASFVWEMDQTLSTDLATMAGRVPAGNDNTAMSFGMSFDILAAKKLASKYVDKAVAEPYACEHFAQFNNQLAAMQAKLNQPLPPFVGNFKGFNFSLDDLKLNTAAAEAENPQPKDMIESFKAQVFLAVDETQALLGMAQMMAPQLQNMDIKTDGSLITLADAAPLISGSDIPIDVANLYAAVSDNTIGFSLGHEGGGALEQKVKQEGDAAFMTAKMNVEGYKTLMEQFFALADMPDMPEEIKQELAIQKDLSLGMLYWKTQDMAILFTDKGFTTDVNYTY